MGLFEKLITPDIRDHYLHIEIQKQRDPNLLFSSDSHEYLDSILVLPTYKQKLPNMADTVGKVCRPKALHELYPA